jgi:DNA-binding LacI/PurR family transcriptional regulator/DNA-binding transcriptional regulator YhcF (GntR family)
MKPLRIRSASEQLADFLKEEIRTRRWTGSMPGESWMVTHLQVGRDTVRAALAQLEKEGVLVSDGQGRRRKIVMSEDDFSRRNIRVRILHYEKDDHRRIDTSSLLAQLLEAGMDADFAGKSLKDLGMQVERVARFVKQNPADAWVVASASQEILEWFAGQATPAIAMFGRHTRLNIAAAYPVMIPGLMVAVRRLIALGHKRIVMLAREERRKPHLSLPEQSFIDELKAAGISTGDYNLPDWEESREGMGRRLDELFRISPPTALIFQEATLFIAARSHLADRGIIAPRDVSLVVADSDPSFAWNHPIPSHIQWDYRPVVRRIVGWARNVAAGKEDRRKVGTETEFIEGGTIGPVRGRSGN